jgi:hypothetical protein
MTDRSYRVLVYGTFDDLDDAARQRLVAERDAHDLLRAAFTDAGTLTYELPIRTFTFRCVVHETVEDATDSGARARADAQTRARAVLDDAGLGYRDLRATETRTDDIVIRRRR